MGSHPLNLGLRFLLELVLLGASGYWGFKVQEGWKGYLLAIGVPVLLAAIWVCFAVPEDPSRSGNTVVVVPGVLRFILEISMFAFGVWALYQSNLLSLAWIFAGLVFVHYLLSYDRILWLFRN